jgi:GMP synthase-like glutamine amidotransferase
MKAHVLQHVSFEGPGSIAPWLEAFGATVSYTRFFENHELPAVSAIDILIIIGGPMSANDEEELPWLTQEKRFIKEAIIRGVPVLGICLGAQLIASALGAKVYRNPEKEIGWFPIQSVPSSNGNFYFPQECIAFHWHGETFDLPTGAERIASSEACENQAFQITRNVIGLQFHLETTPESASDLVENCRTELVPGLYIQNEAEILARPISSYQTANIIMSRVLSYLVNAS